MVRRAVLFALAFAVGCRVAFVVVDTAGQAMGRFPWRDSPRLLAGEATSAVRGRVTDPVLGRLAEARAAIGEGKEAARQRERALRVENHLRQSS